MSLFKIQDYGISLTKANSAQVTVNFKNTETNESINWWGSLKEGKAREITIKNLFLMGFSGDDIAQIASGIEGGALNHIQEYELVIEEHEHEGKKSKRVKFINLPGSGGIKNKLDETSAKDALKALNLKGDVLALKKEMGVTESEKPKEDVPF
jgi:hypothetical protein